MILIESLTLIIALHTNCLSIIIRNNYFKLAYGVINMYNSYNSCPISLAHSQFYYLYVVHILIYHTMHVFKVNYNKSQKELPVMVDILNMNVFKGIC